MTRLGAVIALGACSMFVALLAAGRTTAGPIGVPEWTIQEAIGQPPEADERRLVPGLPMLFRENVLTNERGAADFIFNNSARLLVGAGCDVRLDERFYDPELDLDVMRASMRTITWCVVRTDRVGALSLDDDPSTAPPDGSMAASVGADAADVLAAGEQALTIETDTTTVVIQGSEALISAGAPGEGVRAFKTSPDGSVYVFTDTDFAVIYRAGFDVQVSADGRLTGPSRTDPATLNAAQRRLQAVEPLAAERAELPYVLEPVSEILPDWPRAGTGVVVDPPDHCQLTDTCIGFERVITIEIPDEIIDE